MPRKSLLNVLASSLAVLALAVPAFAEPPSPESFLGHRVGADRKLAPWPKVVEYLRLVDAASERISIESAGMSTQGNDMPVVVLTSEAEPETPRPLPRDRPPARQPGRPLRGGGPQRWWPKGKTIALVTCSIHSTEVGSTQMVMEFVHEVATTRDPGCSPGSTT